jgi:hypothetical protein
MGFQTEKSEKFQKLYFDAYCGREGVPEEQGESKPAGWEYSVLAGHRQLCQCALYISSIFPLVLTCLFVFLRLWLPTSSAALLCAPPAEAVLDFRHPRCLDYLVDDTFLRFIFMRSDIVCISSLWDGCSGLDIEGLLSLETYLRQLLLTRFSRRKCELLNQSVLPLDRCILYLCWRWAGRKAFPAVINWDIHLIPVPG